MWHVSSRSGVATLRTAIHLILTNVVDRVQQGRRVANATSTDGRRACVAYERMLDILSSRTPDPPGRKSPSHRCPLPRPYPNPNPLASRLLSRVDKIHRHQNTTVLRVVIFVLLDVGLLPPVLTCLTPPPTGLCLVTPLSNRQTPTLSLTDPNRGGQMSAPVVFGKGQVGGGQIPDVAWTIDDGRLASRRSEGTG